jgi:hypothetical protein
MTEGIAAINPAWFWSRVKIGTRDDCWLWTGTMSTAGYGRLRNNGPRIYAHRVAYMLSIGEIPDGLLVLHACDNPPCCNPDHLNVGTHWALDVPRGIADTSPRGTHRHLNWPVRDGNHRS